MNFQIKDWKSLINLGIIIVVAIAVMVLLIYINRKCFKKLKKKHQNLHLQLLEKFINFFIFIVVGLLAFSALGGTRNVWQTLLGGTAVLSAVAAFAAQDVIKDMLAGLMISIYKPFDIGDRIELEDGTAGIVKDMTMRHVVINTIDTIKEVIPNSRLNVMQLKNYSFKADCRSVNFRFPVGYGSDPVQVKQIIAEAIEQSEYSVPYRTGENGEKVYSEVYFFDFQESALEMSVTVYYNVGTPTEVVRDDINTRVKQALNAHDIEIPYNYLNIVQKK
ncbi:MAG: mechanosensitive ion channel [Clostridia bacterium]|nr:mechanosensitive ion channel [Clostridia bacterium]